MGKLIPDEVQDKLLNEIATANLMSVTSDTDTPTHLNNTLASTAMDPADFTIEQGDSGAGSRKITIATKTGVDVVADGSPKHVVLSRDGTILLITTCLGPDLTIGSQTDFPEWKLELVKAT